VIVDISDKDAGAWQDAISKTVPGDQIIYHKGPFCAGLHRRAAMQASNRKLVCLVQRKVGAGEFHYIAQRIDVL
jgi:hypothetical protein